MSAIHDSYAELVTTMRTLGAALIPAVAAQYEAPPQGGSVRQKNDKGVTNPTLEIVLDARRSAVSQAISDTASALRMANALLESHIPELVHAVDRWEGAPERLPA